MFWIMKLKRPHNQSLMWTLIWTNQLKKGIFETITKVWLWTGWQRPRGIAINFTSYANSTVIMKKNPFLETYSNYIYIWFVYGNCRGAYSKYVYVWFEYGNSIYYFLDFWVSQNFHKLKKIPFNTCEISPLYNTSTKSYQCDNLLLF